MPAQECPPPVTDFVITPSISVQAWSYPCQRQVEEAPILSMICSLRTMGRGLRHRWVSAYAKTLTRTSLYSITVPGSCNVRYFQSSSPPSRGGRSAQSFPPHNSPLQSEFCCSRCSQVILLLCSPPKVPSQTYRSTGSSTEAIQPWSTASPAMVDKKLLVTLKVMSTRRVSPHSLTR